MRPSGAWSRRPYWVDRSVERVSTMSVDQVALHVAMLLFTGVAAQATRLAGGVLPLPFVLVIGAAAVVSVVAVDAPTVLVLMGAIGWAWMILVEDLTSPYAVVVAIGLLGLHSSAALSSSAPLAARFDRPTWIRWGARNLLVGGATVAVYLVVLGLRALDVPGSVLLTACAVVVVVVVALAARAVGLRRAEPVGKVQSSGARAR